MTLPDPGKVTDPDVQRALDRIRERFPISAKDVAADVATQAEIDDIIAGGVTFGTPGAIQPDDTAAEGVAASSARSDHRHSIAAGAAETITGTNDEGTATSFARSDHDHALGTDTVGSAQIAADAVGASEIAPLAVTDAEVATANKDGVAATPSMRTLGTGATQAAAGDDARLSDSRPPNGAASGVLSGSYPSPDFAVDMATQAELDAEAAVRANAVTAAIALAIQRANHTGTQLASTISDFDTQVRTSRLDQMAAPGVNLSINSHKLINVSDATNALDAVNYQQLLAGIQAAAAGFAMKSTVRVATTANITGTFGALSATGSGTLTVDGILLATGDRVLLKNQTTAAENGVWEYSTGATNFGGTGNFGGVGTFGDPSSGWTLTRPSDADESAEFPGMFVPVGSEGTANKLTFWLLTTAAPITVGTTSLSFSAFTANPIGTAGGVLDGNYPNPGLAAAVAGSGLAETSDVLSVNVDGSTLEINADSLRVKASGITANEIAAGAVATSELATGHASYDYGFVTALPTSPTPVTGDVCTFVDSTTDPTYRWRLQYLSTDTGSYDWQFIGGSPAQVETGTLGAAESTTSTTYVNLTTTGPSFTLPLAGDYDIELGVRGIFAGVGTGVLGFMSYAIGGTGAVDNDSIFGGEDTGSIGSLSNVRRKTGFSASTALVAKYRCNGGTLSFYAPRYLRVTPVRVG